MSAEALSSHVFGLLRYKNKLLSKNYIFMIHIKYIYVKWFNIICNIYLIMCL